jgi:outer membrane cobalamin receptor
LKYAAFFAAVLLSLSASEADSRQMREPDSTKAARADSSSVEDTLQVRFIPAMGSLRQEIDSASEFHSSQFIWSDARYFGNLLWKMPGFFLRDLGESGKPGEINAWGVDWRGVAILMDGRPMNDPITGTYNLYDMPMEFIEQVEDFSGIASSAEAWNAPGATLNFVTHQYNTLRPITKVRYVQGPNNDLMSDGLFTQNVLRGLNFMFGFQRHVSDGRFNGARTTTAAPVPNGAIVNNWNVRTRLRYNFSDRFNVALTDFYTKDINGLNGGIDVARSQNVYDDVGAFVNSPNALETVSRRDVSLLAIGKLFEDSTSITQANAYYTHLLRDYTNPGSEFTPLTISDSHYAELRGIRVQQSFRSDFHETEIGVQSEHSQYAATGFFDSTARAGTVNSAKRTISSAFLTSSLRPTGYATVSLSARLDDFNNQPATSLGAGLKVFPVSLVGVFGEYGQSYRFPTFQESSWADSTIFRPSAIGKEKHTLFRAGVELHLGDDGLLSVAGYDRSVDNAIIFQPARTASGSRAVRILNVPNTHTRGIVGSLSAHYGPFAFEGTLLYTHYAEADTTKFLSPDLMMSGELSYRNQFFNNALDAKIGVRSRFMNAQNGMTFNPQLVLYREDDDTTVGSWMRLDLFAVLKIGDAYITLSYENLLNASYFITPVYPMPDRTLRFGVNWAFLD